jgi:hypothetical protein
MSNNPPYTRNEAKFDLSLADTLMSEADALEFDSGVTSLHWRTKQILTSEATKRRNKANRLTSRVRGVIINCVRKTQPQKYLEMMDALNLPFTLIPGDESP